MNYEQIKEKYPIGKTIIGSVYLIDSFTLNEINKIKKEDYLASSPNSLAFILYDKQYCRLDCYILSYDEVSGYYVGATEDYELMVLSNEYGYERYCTRDSEYYIGVNEDKEMAAKAIVEEYACDDPVFFSYEELAHYVEEKKQDRDI